MAFKRALETAEIQCQIRHGRGAVLEQRSIMAKPRGAAPAPPGSRSAPGRLLEGDVGAYEGQQVGIDQVGMRRGHAVRQARIGFERPVLQELTDLAPVVV